MNGKTFEQRLDSLKIGCIIFAVLTGLSLLSNLSNPYTSPLTIILNIALLCSYYFIYTYTSKRDIKGPIIEMIVGGLYLFEAALILFSFGVYSFIAIILNVLVGILLVVEGNNFYKTISNKTYDNNMNSNMYNNPNNNMNNNMYNTPNNSMNNNMSNNMYNDPNNNMNNNMYNNNFNDNSNNNNF